MTKFLIPDISLRRLDLMPKQAKAMRMAQIDRDFKTALDDLAVVLADFIEEPASEPAHAEVTLLECAYLINEIGKVPLLLR